MTTKFNKDIYVKMRSKKDEPLSNIGKKTVHVTGKDPSVTPTVFVNPIVSVTETTKTASPATLLKRSLLQAPKGRAYLVRKRRRRRLIVDHLLNGMTRDWRWIGLMRP